MKQIAIFSENLEYVQRMEDAVNSWIENEGIHIYDIKFQRTEDECNGYIAVMVIYEQEKEEN